jgi:OmpA-OmpF porin, OOP family
MKTTLNFFAALAISFFAVTSCLADDLIQTDIKGHSDHPLLKRFENSTLVAGDKRAFDEFVVALGRVEFDYGAQQFKPWPREKVEGARHTAFYRMPKDVTTLEALKNYENDLKSKGFEVLFSGSSKELDNGYGRFVKQVYTSHQDNHLMQYVLPAADDFRYLAMRKTNEDGSQVVFSGLFGLVPSGWGSKYAKSGDVVARIDVLETKPITQRMVTIKAEEMAQQIEAAGKVALYGIFFDFNRADIKPESEPTLAEVAKYLAGNGSVKLLVAGHTDNVGGFEFNRDLSQRRAQAVVEYLAAHHNVSRERLFPFGVSFAAPVATNGTEEGKAKNRRVELVKY